MPFSIEPLSGDHDRSGFVSGVEALDRYLATQASQDVRRRASACFVAIDDETRSVAGYYTLAASSILLSEQAPDTARRLPRYPLVPAGRIGRLAVARSYLGLGAALLADAVARTTASELVAFAVVVDAKDEAALAFYQHHGFQRFNSAPMSLYLPIADALRRLARQS